MVECNHPTEEDQLCNKEVFQSAHNPNYGYKVLNFEAN